jgi:hypothetical protein
MAMTLDSYAGSGGFRVMATIPPSATQRQPRPLGKMT